jgi:transcriptional regulator with XRE-family HTH domain
MCPQARTLWPVAAKTDGETTWARWLRERLRERGWQPIDITRRTGIASSQTSRWLDSPRLPDAASVRKVCAALNVPKVEGLIAAGILEHADIDGVVIVEQPDPRKLTAAELVARQRELLEETATRLRNPGAATVTHLPAHPDDGLFNPNVIWGPPADTAHRDTQ